MLSNKPMRFRLIVSGGTLAALINWLYFQQYLWIWFPSELWNSVFLMSALGGAFFWSWTLPHPRQERKRREAILSREREAEYAQAMKEAQEAARETLAEKRP